MTDARLVLALLAAAVAAGSSATVVGNPSAAAALAALRAPPGPAAAPAPAAGRGVAPAPAPGPAAARVPSGAWAGGPAASGVAAPRWRWPVSPRPPVVRPFDAPASPWGAGHRGLDLAAVPGDGVLAVEAGTVTHVGTVAGRGTVTVLHADGLGSTYEPVAASVSVGARVAAGDVLGVLEDGAVAHCGRRGCLHLGARTPPAYLDPLPLLTGGGRIRLLPLGPAP